MTDSFAQPIHLAGTLLASHRHICGFFDDPEDEYRALLPFVQEGLERNELALHIVDPARRSSYARQFEQRGTPLAELEKSGRFELLTWSETYLRQGEFDPDAVLALVDRILQERRSRFPLVRLITHINFPGGQQKTWDDWVSYEARLNRLLSKYPDPVVCAYESSKFHGGLLMDLMRAHPVVIVRGLAQSNPFFVPPDDFLVEFRQRVASRPAPAAQRESPDLAEQKRGQELRDWLQLQFEQMPLACIIADPQIRIIDWNPAAEQIFGYRRDEVLGKNGYQLLVSAPSRAQVGEIAHRPTAGELSVHSINENVTKDGRIITCEWHNTPLQNAKGEVIAILSTGQDITERKQAQADRERLLASEREARSEAERSARLKDDFLATLSHELRTPLSAIIGWTDIIKMRIANPAQVMHAVEVIARNARTQAQLVADLLDLSRIISGKMRLDVQPTELRQVIEAAIEAIKPAAEAKGIQIDCVLERISMRVHGDASRLQQIFWNLLSNAVKFTGEDGRVQVLLSRVNFQAEIAVRDNGKGIGVDFLPHVFERFRQADAASTREQGGLGIGLALVKELTQLHDGQVSAASEGPGKGSTFTVKLPLAIRPEEGVPRQHPQAPASMLLGERNLAMLSGVKVLLVDDDPDSLEVIQEILVERGVEVTVVPDAESALAALGTVKFDVLLSDIGMPRFDGYEFIAEVRKRGLKTPAAAVTAFARSEDRTRALLSGFQAHVSKPLERSELLATVASLAGRP
jgi:PAS domain S-box-containing protein